MDFLEIIKAQCQEYNDISSCPEDQIFIQGRQSGDGTSYVPYTPDIEANYNIQTIYGHDNLCLPKSNICNANLQDSLPCPDDNCIYEPCSDGYFRNSLG